MRRGRSFGVSRVSGEGRPAGIYMDNGKLVFVGYFEDEKEAARAYDTKAAELFEEYAALNFSGV